jgi:hypothetical protein
MTEGKLRPISFTNHSAYFFQSHVAPAELIHLSIANPSYQIYLIFIQGTNCNRSVQLRNQEIYTQFRDFVEDRRKVLKVYQYYLNIGL